MVTMSEQAAPTPAEDLRALAARLRTWRPAYDATRFSGRGIVVCAGGAQIFTNAYVLVSVLRRTLGCRLPIDVWHFGAAEMSPSMAAMLRELDVSVVDALPHIAAEHARVRDGWQLKPFAMLNCRFEEVLLLDADQVPVKDPTALFDWPEYETHGAIFWPDAVELRADNPVWASLGLPPRRTISLESGQVLVDKRRHWRPLCVVSALNEAAEQLYQLIYGDKDCFLIGWELAGASHAQVPFQPFSDERCLVQRDFLGAPLFQHRSNSKWSYAGAQHEIEGFVHLEACVAALEDLRRRWNGTIFHAPDRSLAARQAEAELIGAGPLLLEARAEESFPLQLLPFGEIAAGRASDRQNWWCEQSGAAIALAIGDADRVWYRLTRVDDTLWQGMRHRAPQYEVTLRRQRQSSRPSALPGLVDELLRAAGFPDHGEVARAELSAALTLLFRVEPKGVERLGALAEAADESTRQQLQALIDTTSVEANTHAIKRDMVLDQYYRFVGKDGQG